MVRVFDKLEKISEGLATNAKETALVRQDIAHLREIMDKTTSAHGVQITLMSSHFQSEIERVRTEYTGEIKAQKILVEQQSTRIDVLERLRWQLIGACLVLSFVLSVAIKVLPFS